ncbi:calcium-binding mitochondrial carrier protein SCaMC-2-A-like [Zeugodacus cucurbitae]|uniref:calcium-binding mitochondrial carrier protein SCaMC-2-A-like n=1 Tax=Zeugodacus cucurbitae TaxID=28588 RepID=UPI0023D929E4|nr:calcium-binding mitochondrial carrier protein SCaMC-2-A-like [Zeugodacus cucurbitae]
MADNLQEPEQFTEGPMKSESVWWRHSISGGLAGVISRTSTAPIDRLKLYMQVQTRKTSILDSANYMIKTGGIRSMWRGNGVNVLKIGSDSAIKFTVYEKVKHFIKIERNSSQDQMTIGERFIAGAIAGSISQTVVYPFDVLKTRLALRTTVERLGLINLVQSIYKTEGLRTFYNGYTINLMGVIPYAGIDLALYETLKKYLSGETTNTPPNSLILLACGAVSSAVGQIITYPCSLIRTRIQAQVVRRDERRTGITQRPVSRDTTIGIIRNIIINEGLSGLYRGLIINLVKVIPAVCISYIVYEYSIRTLGVSMS